MRGDSITCSDCGEVFVFGEAERSFYESKGLVVPKRCKACRAARKNVARPASGLPRPERFRWEAACTGCGARASVPFEPTPGREVFCARCWRDRRTPAAMESAHDGVVVDALDLDSAAANGEPAIIE
jgi:CxxC-x17-CxxC domain-containing protein